MVLSLPTKRPMTSSYRRNAPAHAQDPPLGLELKGRMQDAKETRLKGVPPPRTRPLVLARSEQMEAWK